MKRFIQILAPADPPFTPMTFTRIPVVHRFWFGGLAAAAMGFPLGFGLWMWQHGIFTGEGHFFLFKLWHARLQIEGFLGSFLLGFALQSGPHIAGGKPPPSKSLLWLFTLLWCGLTLSFVPLLEWLGAGLVSLAYGGAGYFLWVVTRDGNPALRTPRGLPLASAMTLMAITPWLPLDDPGYALFILWCGPVTMALVAAQQLIQNVLGGRLLQGRSGNIFATSLLLAWLASGMAAFTAWGSWPLAGLCWLATLAILIVGSDFIRAVWRFGWASISITLTLGLLYGLQCVWLMLQKDWLPDMAVHLLGSALMTTLVIGVTVRVAGFFSAGAVLSDRVTSYLLILWGVVALTRSYSPMTPMDEMWSVWMSLLGSLILLTWGVRTGYRLTQIHKLLPPTLLNKKMDA
ncbi:MAG: NnrS family protein [Magnetococcales bacterium]|nr:NnrS family protein [Magnetococcales bacterium]MBF0438087.1 NnrS family protein [Magnetococcales bacterium]